MLHYKAMNSTDTDGDTCLLFSIQNSGLIDRANLKGLILVPANLKYLVIFMAYSYLKFTNKTWIETYSKKLFYLSFPFKIATYKLKLESEMIKKC